MQLAYTLISQNVEATTVPGQASTLQMAPAATGNDEKHTVRILVPEGQAGGLIGKKGSMINSIRMQSGAYVKVANKTESAPGVDTFLSYLDCLIIVSCPSCEGKGAHGDHQGLT